MTVHLSALGGAGWQFLDNNGVILSGGLLYIYQAGTTTPATTYTSVSGATAHANPIVLDSAGRVASEIWITEGTACKFTLKTSAGVELWTKDNIEGVNDVSAATSAATAALDAFEASLAASSGSSLVGYTQPGVTAVARTVQARLRDVVSAKDFGATGDGSTDDTAALQAAINYAVANGRDLYIPDGTYIVNQLTYNSTSYALMPSIYGSGRNQTIIKKKAGSTVGALLTIGSFAATNFMANVTIEGITFDGLNSSTSTYGVICYNFVRSRIVNCIVKNCNFGVYFQGGIASWLVDCVIISNRQGFTADSFASAAGANWPNYHILQRCIISDNTLWGVYFDNGRMLRVLDCDVEGNGTTADTTTGGIRVGPDIDSEDSGANPFGMIITNTWLESNAGAAAIVMLSGRNMIYNCNIVANVNAVYDIYAEDCNYNLYESIITTSNSPSIYETGSVLVGNTITAVAGITLAEMSINRAKTQVDFGGYSAPLAQMPSGLPIGTRGSITDSTVTASGNFGAAITGGGVNFVPAYYDGTNWRIG